MAVRLNWWSSPCTTQNSITLIQDVFPKLTPLYEFKLALGIHVLARHYMADVITDFSGICKEMNITNPLLTQKSSFWIQYQCFLQRNATSSPLKDLFNCIIATCSEVFHGNSTNVFLPTFLNMVDRLQKANPCVASFVLFEIAHQLLLAESQKGAFLEGILRIYKLLQYVSMINSQWKHVGDTMIYVRALILNSATRPDIRKLAYNTNRNVLNIRMSF